MRIVVTGAAGFVGSHLCERLAALGHRAVGVDSFTNHYPVRLKVRNAGELADAGVRVERLDLASDQLEEVVADAELVFHLAAQPGISAHVPPEAYVRNNLVATSALLEACAARRPAPFLVNVSTSSVYGRRATAAETALPEPISSYGVTKLAAEQLALAHCREGRLPVCSMRLFSVYGPRERPEKLYMKLITSILKGEEFPLYEGSQDHERAYTFVDDAVAGLLAVLDHRDRCPGEIFNIGSETGTSTRRGIEIVEEIPGRKPRLKVLPARPETRSARGPTSARPGPCSGSSLPPDWRRVWRPRSNGAGSCWRRSRVELLSGQVGAGRPTWPPVRVGVGSPDNGFEAPVLFGDGTPPSPRDLERLHQSAANWLEKPLAGPTLPRGPGPPP